MEEMLVSAARDVFASMLGTDIRRIPDDGQARPDQFDGILSLIGLTGAVVGNGLLSCPVGTACDLSSRFLMSEFSTADDEVLDAVGEIANMIIGGFKNRLEGQLGDIQMSVPTVIRGKNIGTRSVGKDVTVRAVCAYEGHSIMLEIGLARGRVTAGE